MPIMNEKLKIVVKWIIGQQLAANQTDIAFKLGVNKTYLSQLVIGKKIVSLKFIEKLCEKFPEVNSDYLTSGDVRISKIDENINEIEILKKTIEALKKEIAELINLREQIKENEQL